MELPQLRIRINCKERQGTIEQNGTMTDRNKKKTLFVIAFWQSAQNR